MAKDKKKKKNGKKSDGANKAKAGLKSIAQNPLVADVVAAALVATAAAIKDNRKARQLAEQASDELSALAKEGAEKGNAMWQLALEVGRRAVDTLVGEAPAKPAKPAKAAKPAKPVKAAKKPKRGTTAAKPN